MSKDHGLAGLFGDDGTLITNRRTREPEPAEKAAPDDLPPVLDDADKSPLARLSDQIGYDYSHRDDERSGDEFAEPHAPELEPAPEPAPKAAKAPKAAPEKRRGLDFEDAYDPYPPSEESGVLCFLIESDSDRLRRRTLAALNMAAGNGSVRLRLLPSQPDEMDRVLEEALADTDCSLVAFLSPGTEPADDWALECQNAFASAPRTAAMSVRAANSDPLSPWARVSFFIDEAERQRGVYQGFDTTVFRKSALEELGGRLGYALRTGQLIAAVQGRGHRVGLASEARVSLVTPSARRDVIRHVKDQTRMAAKRRAQGKFFLYRWYMAGWTLLSYPLHVLRVRKSAKRAIGGTQFREVAPKAAMAIFAERRVRALTWLFPGRKEKF
jgi:hypothetical protein